MKLYVILFLVINCITLIENASILAIFALPSKSHFVMFERVLKELVTRGHEIDVVSHFPLKKPIAGYNDLSLVGSQPVFVNNLTLDQVKFDTTYEFIEFMMVGCGTEVCRTTFEKDSVIDLMKTKKKYDLLITEIFTSDCMLGFAHKFKIPVVGMTSSVNLPWASDRFANPDNPSYIPTYFVDFTPRMSFLERILNTWSLIRGKMHFNTLSANPSNRMAKAFFGQDLPDLEELAYNTSIILVNSHFSMNQIRPAVPGFLEIGGVHIEEPKPLDPHFDELLNTESKGIIYLSMGSMLKTESFPPEKIQGIFDAFAELPYKIIWKANKAHFKESLRFPKNVHFEKWMPQLDILCDPRVKLFVSHGGLMGSQEAVYCGVPRLGIPIFADQELNIRQSENMGLAIKVAYEDISKERILTTARKLLSDPIYKSNAEKASILFKDRPMSPLATAMYWIEYVIRHKGAPHLKSVATELYWYQYYLLDVALFFVLIIAGVLYGLIKVAGLFRSSTKVKRA